jgi:hypothetical protein
MNVQRLWAAAVCVALLGPAARAGQYNVYYRASTSSPWQFYAAGLTSQDANTTAADLRSIGYLTDVVASDAPPAVITNVATGGTGAFTSYVGPSYYWWNGGHAVDWHDAQHWDWQHHDWHHHHVGPGPHPPHPTPHPHPRPHPHPHHHPVYHYHAHHHTHHASHHASHHHEVHHHR